MSMELNLACEPRLSERSAVMTGGTALALWIRHLGTLYPRKKEQGVEKEFELAESIADWDFHPTRPRKPSEFFGDADCKLVADEGQSKPTGIFKDRGQSNRKGIFKDEEGDVTQNNCVSHPDGCTYKKYGVNGVVLRDIVAELFPRECTTDPYKGCALVDYGYLPPHKSDFEGPIIEKLGLTNNYTFPLPPSIGVVPARDVGYVSARNVVSLLHPEVVIVAHLQALSMDNFLNVSHEKTRRRAARVKCFYKLYDWEGFKIGNDKVAVRGGIVDAMERFVKTSFCEVVLSDDEAAKEKLYTDTKDVLTNFEGKTSFMPNCMSPKCG